MQLIITELYKDSVYAFCYDIPMTRVL